MSIISNSEPDKSEIVFIVRPVNEVLVKIAP
jgi:hypothetical protein